MCHFQVSIGGIVVLVSLEGNVRRLSIFSSIVRIVCLRSRSTELLGMAIGENMEKGGKLCPPRSGGCLGLNPSKNSGKEKELREDNMGDASI